ncbi:hypothetical protein [Acinetobacter sp. CFCC 10889]|uniref:hypothetical protein n=1 Tax=Acinetobacter sp. CFCC 10889 TaxID=1775557 RepID=UPI000DD04E44|nr:hypothetical protein [Acinetobacter sp. CFCC 10889]
MPNTKNTITSVLKEETEVDILSNIGQLTELDTTSKTRVLAVAEIEILKTKFYGVYEKTENGMAFLVAPTSPTSPKEYKIKEIIKELTDYGVDENAFKEKLNSILPKDKADQFEEISITLNTLFFYRLQENNKPAEYEYAFSIQINLDEFADIGFAKLEKVSLSIWNTQREKVIEQMNLKSINEYLNDY